MNLDNLWVLFREMSHWIRMELPISVTVSISPSLEHPITVMKSFLLASRASTRFIFVTSLHQVFVRYSSEVVLTWCCFMTPHILVSRLKQFSITPTHTFNYSSFVHLMPLTHPTGSLPSTKILPCSPPSSHRNIHFFSMK